MSNFPDKTAIARFDQNSRRSRMAVHGNTIYLAGQCADDLAAGVAQQTREALARIDRLLEEAGSDRSRLLSVQIWLADMADLDAMNEVYDAWVVPNETPARCCGQAALAMSGAKVEVIATAAV